MKKFIISIFLFFSVVSVIDVGFGMVCRYLNRHAKGGDTRLHYHIATECDADILIFGSSRAFHHYVPSVIEDSLGVSCYNCGYEGMGIVFSYSRLLMMTERYTPKLIIYDVCDNFDVCVNDNSQYLGCQKRFLEQYPTLSSVTDLISCTENLKCNSSLYRFNSFFVQMLMDNIKPMPEATINGYRPLHNSMTYEPTIKEKKQLTQWDPVKYECMIRFISLCKQKGIKLVFCFSPSYGNHRYSCEGLISKLCQEQDIPFLNFYNIQEISSDKRYFKDSVHLNDTGAVAFTKCLLQEFRKYWSRGTGCRINNTM